MNYINDTELEQVEGGILPLLVAIAVVLIGSALTAQPLGQGSDLSCGCGCSCCK